VQGSGLRPHRFTHHLELREVDEVDAAVVGFASGKRQLTLYLAPGFEGDTTRDLLARLGKHKTGKGCLYLTRLADVDLQILEELVRWSAAEIRRRFPQTDA
jgi:hypothetical protein